MASPKESKAVFTKKTKEWFEESEKSYCHSRKIKRIIDGKAYNTETASYIHHANYSGERGCEILYQTKHGAYFLVSVDNDYGSVGLRPVTDDAARQWLEQFEKAVNLIEELFGPMPEGGSAQERVILRVPGILYRRMAAAAEAQGQTVNAYVMRLLQSTHPA